MNKKGGAKFSLASLLSSSDYYCSTLFCSSSHMKLNVNWLWGSTNSCDIGSKTLEHVDENCDFMQKMFIPLFSNNQFSKVFKPMGEVSIMLYSKKGDFNKDFIQMKINERSR